MYRLQIVSISPCPCHPIGTFSCSAHSNTCLLFFLLLPRMKRAWSLFSLSQTVPSHLRQGQGPSKSPCPSVSGSVPPLTPLMPRGRTGSSWLKSSTLIGMSYSAVKTIFRFFFIHALVIYLQLNHCVFPKHRCINQLVCFVPVL